MERTKVSFFDIQSCGYYRRGGRDAPAFGGLPETLTALQQWARGKALQDTKIFEPAEHADLHPVYLANIMEAEGTWLLVTWNQTPSTETGVASISGRSNVGAVTVHSNPVETGTIPGFATYFWVVPERKLLATIRCDRTTATGQKGLQKYVEQFLSNFSPWVVVGPDPDNEEETRVLGYRRMPSDELTHPYPRFKTARHVNNHSLIEEIRHRHPSIRAVKRRQTLKHSQQADIAVWRAVYYRLTGRTAPTVDFDMRFSYEMPLHPSLEEINMIQAQWEADAESEWDDVGFVISGCTEPIWLSGASAKGEVDLQLRKDHPSLINADDLLAKLNANKTYLLGLVE